MSSQGSVAYVLGSTDAEHLRLVRQARLLEPLTERLLSEAGIGHGMRVLDFGCGMGDVSMLAARLVGPAGRVIGVDQDERVLVKARERAHAAGYENISFLCSDVANVTTGEQFDAAVGRFILQFVADPLVILKVLHALVRSGGALAFQEVSYPNMMSQNFHLPLRHAVLQLIHDTVTASGVRTQHELLLFRDFKAAGFSSPSLRNELLLGDDPAIRRYLFDLLLTLWPKAGELNVPRDKLGDLSTLAARLDAELDENNSFATCISVVNAFARRL